ncbi:hypothetical protein BHE74_00018076 [Ensete ventricosum]|nr:hypothetical protein BHE74_00018076 [Ensete ventricosum]RZR85417.1 hypothetical protein BHM03_00012392 [Ensete ventricosum]
MMDSCRSFISRLLLGEGGEPSPLATQSSLVKGRSFASPSFARALSRSSFETQTSFIWVVTLRITEGIEKLAGNTPGDRRKKTIGLATRMPEAAGLGGS